MIERFKGLRERNDRQNTPAHQTRRTQPCRKPLQDQLDGLDWEILDLNSKQKAFTDN